MSTAERVRPDPRISRRRRAVERAARRRLAFRVAGGIFGAVMVWAALWSPLLEVETIDVQGAAHITADDISEATGVLGDNLLFLSAGKIASEVEELPWVAGARVDRLLPNTLRVRIVERSPALVVASTSESWVVDGSGYLLQPARGNEALPKMSTPTLGGADPGERLPTRSLLAGVRAFASLPTDLADRVESVLAPTAEAISFALRGGTVVRYGAAEEMRDKNEVIAALLERFTASEGRLYLDVRVPANPAVSGAQQD